jgi:hypothetical protein
MLKSANSRAGDVENQLSQDNNDLKKAISKHKNGKQICMDLCLLMTFLLLLGVLVKMFETKGFF